MTSKAIILGVVLPMVIFGAFIALFIAPIAQGVESTIEFVGSLIGILGVVFMISGLFYKKEIIVSE
jgi:flagellar biosynthesis protein FliQ